jgi:hypothetical protein
MYRLPQSESAALAIHREQLRRLVLGSNATEKSILGNRSLDLDDSLDWHDARSEIPPSESSITEDFTSTRDPLGLNKTTGEDSASKDPLAKDVAVEDAAFPDDVSQVSRSKSTLDNCKSAHDIFMERLEEQCEPEERFMLKCIVNLGASLNINPSSMRPCLFSLAESFLQKPLVINIMFYN